MKYAFAFLFLCGCTSQVIKNDPLRWNLSYNSMTQDYFLTDDVRGKHYWTNSVASADSIVLSVLKDESDFRAEKTRRDSVNKAWRSIDYQAPKEDK